MARSMRAPCASVLLLLLAAACGPGAAEQQRVGGETMGSTWSLKYFAPVATAQVRVLVEDELAVVDRVFSR